MSLATWVAEGAGMPKYAGDLPDWRPDDQDPMRGDLPFYLETDADRSSYAALRQSNVPVYCFVQGLESAACLVVQGGYLERIGLQVL